MSVIIQSKEHVALKVANEEIKQTGFKKGVCLTKLEMILKKVSFSDFDILELYEKLKKE